MGETVIHFRAQCGCEVEAPTGPEPVRVGYCPLHAAAPDLLAALEALAPWDEPTDVIAHALSARWGDSWQVTSHDVDKARRAIRKAKP